MDSLESSYAYAERVARRAAKNFRYTFLLLPADRRRSIRTVYTFSRRLDDAVDAIEENGVDPAQATKDLDFLRSMLSTDPPDDPLVPALRHTVERFRIPRELFDELVDGMHMDLTQRRYETFQDLYTYCYRAAAVVGLICMEIFGYSEPRARKRAEELGIAMQLTNILRDVEEDLRRGRIYLPRQDLERFGCTEESLLNRQVDDRFRALMKFQVERARDYFQRAEELFPLVDVEARYCPILLKRFYAKILDRIERQDFDVLSRRPRLGLREKLQLLLSTWLECRRARKLGAGEEEPGTGTSQK
ncbi:MAG: phytoene/squalene synthase family protein [Planctomycetota bacterium]|nr:phytoene/squalene synthase family protein [Planctomycetota bacterium]